MAGSIIKMSQEVMCVKLAVVQWNRCLPELH